MSGNFALIASYPKSGNTWTRIVFERLARGIDLPLNSMDGNLHGTTRRLMFDTFAPVNASDLLPDEVDNYLPGVYRSFAAGFTGTLYLKVHECARTRQDALWLYPPEIVSAVIYLVRHPFDVAVSLSNHFALPLENAVDFMANDRTQRLSLTWAPEPLPLAFGSWSDNVLSWMEATPYRRTFARYEDIHADATGQFLRLANEIGMKADRDAIERVVEASSFENLKREEQEQGFRERPDMSSVFFRSGKPRSWDGVLDRALQDRLVRDHLPVMQMLGYAADGSVGEMPPR